jgi:hypothetical protein
MGCCEHSNVFHKRAAKQVLACQRYNMRLFNEPYRLIVIYTFIANYLYTLFMS